MSQVRAKALLDELSRLGVLAKGAGVDSRRIQPGDIFMAWPGYVSDGRLHVDAAIARGAAAVLYENSDGRVLPELPVPAIGVSDLKTVAGYLGHAIYRQPSSSLWMFGVTGTNGKTSVTHWLASALGGIGERCGVVGTMGSGFPGQLAGEALNTTPDVLSLHRLLRGFVDEGASAVAMEVSSIGLEQGRVDGVEFDTVVFTNLTRDHLDYHGDMESYGNAKTRLFALPGVRHSVINLDDAFGRKLIARVCADGLDCIAYSLEADSVAGNVRLLRGQLLPSQAFGTHLRVFWQGRQGDIRARVLGRFNAQNLLALVASLITKGVGLDDALAVASALEAPRGRMELQGGVGEPLVVIDYAHSPDALRKILEACRETAMSRGGRLVCVFGCGGDRDAGKRPLMGEAACEFADRVLVTSDNPRTEDPASIITDILSGASASAERVLDRAEAIAQAIAQASPNDVIVLAGKGHETYQEIRGCRMPFSDSEHAASALGKWARAQGGCGMMTLQDAAAAIGGRSTANVRFSSVSTDSRKVSVGALFVALRGDNFDGHEFVGTAAAEGAVAALVDASWVAQNQGCPLPLLVVADTRLALGALAACWRGRFKLPVIGVTGSNGKTTVKEMCASILRAQVRLDGGEGRAVLSTQGNYNNDIGLPLTLFNLSAEHRYAVIEMGMNHPGEIAYLTRIAQPTVAVVTNAQRAHLQGVGSVADVAVEKGAIYQGLDADGVAIVNADDSHADYWRGINTGRRIIDFGLNNDACVGGRYDLHGMEALLTLQLDGVERVISLSVPGVHNIRNALAAAAACSAAGASLDAIVQGLQAYAGTKGRLQRMAGVHGCTLVDDSYNANPDSVLAAIDVLAATPGRRILVLGDMGEIGGSSAQLHDEIGGYAKSKGVDSLFALGDVSAVAARNFGDGGQHFRTLDGLLKALRPLLDADTVVLVKGSRFMRMERVVDALVGARAKAAQQKGGTDAA